MSSRVERRQHRHAHQHRVVLAVVDRQRAGAAELQPVGIALVAVVAGDQQRGEVVDPFPDQAVQVVHAVARWRGCSPARGSACVGRTRVPGEDALAPRRIVAGIAARFVGRRRVFPFVPASAGARLRASQYASRREPADPRHRLLAAARRRRASPARPVREVARLRRRPPATRPRRHSRMRVHEREELAVGDRLAHQREAARRARAVFASSYASAVRERRRPAARRSATPVAAVPRRGERGSSDATREPATRCTHAQCPSDAVAARPRARVATSSFVTRPPGLPQLLST